MEKELASRLRMDKKLASSTGSQDTEKMMTSIWQRGITQEMHDVKLNWNFENYNQIWRDQKKKFITSKKIWEDLQDREIQSCHFRNKDQSVSEWRIIWQ